MTERDDGEVAFEIVACALADPVTSDTDTPHITTLGNGS